MLSVCVLSVVLAAAQPVKGTPGGVEVPAAQKPPAKPDAAQTHDPSKPLVPFPHPLITEVLFGVPTGEGGDANKDGTRQVAGDEFVELVNPHDKPISLGGYTLSDMTALEKTSTGKAKSGAVRWTFPALTLKPGQVAVVFNGNGSTIAGSVGDSGAAAAKGNDAFGGAFVFTMRQPTDNVAFANTADWVMLTAPDGKAVELIKWGEPRVKVPVGILLVEDAPVARNCSVQRVAPTGPFAPHATDGTVSFSPGVFAMPVVPAPEPKAEQPKPSEPPAKPPETAAPPAAGEKPAELPKKPRF